MRGSNCAEGQSGEPHGVVVVFDDNGEQGGHVGRIAKCDGAGCYRPLVNGGAWVQKGAWEAVARRWGL